MEISIFLHKFIWMAPLGFCVGLFGTLIGAGGGFILVPILLLVYPDKSPETITSISLAVVFFNSLSGSLSYSRMKRIDYKSGLLFSATVIPGAIIGAFSIQYVPRLLFDLIFGILLIAISFFLMLKPEPENKSFRRYGKKNMIRSIIDSDGINYTFSFNPYLGLLLGFFVGFLSSLLGIGGGVIHVPAMIHLLNYPVHIATATSHFMLAIMTASGTFVHIVSGALDNGYFEAIALGIGVVIGSPFGAKLSNKLHGKWIVRSLAVALIIIGIRILLVVF